MVTLNYALAKVLEYSAPLGVVEVVPLWDSVGRVLASDITSDINMPPFNKSAVDGYACKIADLNQPLSVAEVIAAGQMPKIEIKQGTCSKIMTGAPVPLGAECVIMVEEVEELQSNQIKFTGTYSKTNIALFAEDVKVGDVVLKKGVSIEPQHIAILAAVGVSNVEVSAKPKVAILVTGDELVEPNVSPTQSQIRNSNGHQLYAQIVRAGGTPIYGGIIDDTQSSTYKAIQNALNESNIVVLTGGVSMGDFDFVPKVLSDLGVEILFQTIAVQPGKPTLFGVKGNKLVFGLPGNPVSSLFQFDFLVRSAIIAMMEGSNPVRPIVKVPIAQTYKRRNADRLALVPATINGDGEALPIDYHGSAHIFALANATCVIMVPIGAQKVEKGELVDVRSI
jgi:molybdopterin molybdotransferase